MDSKKSRSSRARQYDDRRDLVAWDKVYTHLSDLTALREENLTISKYIKDSKAKVEDASPENAQRQIAKLHKFIKEGEDSSTRIKSKVADIKELLKVLKMMHALKDYSNIPVERDDKRIKLDSGGSGSASSSVGLGSSSLSRAHSRAKPSPGKDVIPIGSMVAAKVVDTKDPNQEWILATVVHYYMERNKYQVEDAEADESDGQKSKYIISARNVIPLPAEQDLSYGDEFPMNHEVLALYPNTTCFYKATVRAPPSKNRGRSNHQYDYMVYFDDDDDAERFIPRNMVVDMPTTQRSRS